MSGFKEKLNEIIRKIGGCLKKKEVFSWAREYKDQNNPMVENTVSTSLEEKVYQGTKFDRSKTHIDIPFGYTSIGWGAFSDCSSLQSITIPDSVTSIGEGAFSECEGLKSITIPDSVTSIGDEAFRNCSSLQSITIGEGVTSIGASAFSDCSGLQSITIGEAVTSIGNWAFADCSGLQSITIPDSVTSIGASAFSGCSNLNIFNFVSHGKIYGLRKAMMSDLFAVVSQKEKYLKYLSKSIPQRAVDDLIEKRKIDDIEDLSAFHTLINKFGDREKSDGNIYDLVSFGFNLGIFSNEKIQYRGQNGKVTEMKVRELAYNVLQKVLSTGIDINDIHSHFHSMQVTEFNKEFLLFLNKKNNLEELIEEERVNSGFITRVYSWFNERKHTDISTAEYVDMTEENRYQVQVYETTESGIDKLRWREPNVENLKKEFASKKFINVTSENRHIAEQMSKFLGYEQKHFDKAIEIDRERKEKGTPDHILEREVKQSIEEAWKEYFEEVEKTKNEILDVAQDTLKTQTETAGKIFTYEMLKKSDEVNFCMGFLTNCCANLYGAGAGAQRAMIVSPDMQPLVIRDNRGDIVCFGIVYVNREESYAVVNDFELNKKYQNASSEVTEKIYKKAIQGVKEFVKEYDKEESEKARKDSGYVAKPIRIVTCGVSPNWSKGGLNQYIEREKSHHTLKAPNFNEYKYSGSGNWSGDWHGSQYVIYEREGEKRNEK